MRPVQCEWLQVQQYGTADVTQRVAALQTDRQILHRLSTSRQCAALSVRAAALLRVESHARRLVPDLVATVQSLRSWHA